MPQSRSKKVSFFPVALKIIAQKRFKELRGVTLIACGIFTLLSLMSYEQNDSSLNTVSSFDVQNLGGDVGALLSDLMFQFFGFSSFLLPIILVMWGGMMVLKRKISHLSFRILSVGVALSLLSALIALVSENKNTAEISGVVGLMLGQKVPQYFAIQGHKYLLPFGFIAAFFCFASMYVASNLTKKDIIGFAQFIQTVSSFIKMTLDKMVGLTQKMMGLGARIPKNDPEVERWEEAQEDFSQAFDEPQTMTVNENLFQEIPDEPFPVVKNKITKKKSQKAIPLKLSTDDGSYMLPSLDLLVKAPMESKPAEHSQKMLEENSLKLSSVLGDFGVKGEITKVRPGPVVTLYELVPAAGIKSSRIIGLADDIARSMCSLSARISVIPGKNAMGIEMPNKKRQTVYLEELLCHENYEHSSAKLTLALGKNIGGTPIVADLAKMPHMIVAGTTGSGKSVGVNAMILSLLYRFSPKQCRFIMIDPKMLELSVYDGIPHLLSPVVTDPKKAVYALKWTVREMEDRYRAMSRLGVRNIEGYNAKVKEALEKGENLTREVHTGFDPETGEPIYESQSLDMSPLPYIVVIVDEMADLMMVAGKDIEAAVQRLAQMARAAGIHVIMATQRPSVDVITGTIKANFPTRISFQVTSKFDSKTILGEMGGEQLLGRGDMLFMEPGGKIQRLHGPFVSDEEVERVVKFLKSQGSPDYVDNVTEEGFDAPTSAFGEAEEKGDALYSQAVSIVLREQKASTSFVQRHLKIGYNRAARIIEQMEQEGIISPANHAGKRDILQKAG